MAAPPPGRKCGVGLISQGMGMFTVMKPERKGGRVGDQEPQDPGDETLDDRLREELHRHVPMGPADGLQHADLPRPLRHVSRHRLEGDKDGDEDGDERGNQGEFIRHGEKTPQELQEGVRGGDGDFIPQNAP